MVGRVLGCAALVAALIAYFVATRGSPRRVFLNSVAISAGLWALYLLVVTFYYERLLRSYSCDGVLSDRQRLEAEYFAVQTLTTTGYGFELSVYASARFFQLATNSMIVGAMLWTVTLSLLFDALIKLRAPAAPASGSAPIV